MTIYTSLFEATISRCVLHTRASTYTGVPYCTCSGTHFSEAIELLPCHFDVKNLLVVRGADPRMAAVRRAAVRIGRP